VLETVLETGTDDVTADEEHHGVLTVHDALHVVGESQAGLEPDLMKLTYIPGNHLTNTGLPTSSRRSNSKISV
jgi:hypothetical protein